MGHRKETWRARDILISDLSISNVQFAVDEVFGFIVVFISYRALRGTDKPRVSGLDATHCDHAIEGVGLFKPCVTKAEMGHLDSVGIRFRVNDGQLDERGVEATQILNTLGETIIADQPFPFLLFGLVEPVDAFVDEPAEDFGTHKVGDGYSDVEHVQRCSIAKKTAHQVKRRKGWRESGKDVEIRERRGAI